MSSMDKVATFQSARNCNIDTSTKMEIRMAAKDDGEKLREKEDQRIVDHALQAVCKIHHGRKNSWQKGSGKKGRQGQEKSGKGDNRTCWTCGKTGHIAVESAATQTCTPFTKMRVKTLKKHLTLMKSCKRGVCWKNVKMSSGKG